jgi:hypothetical protein
VELEEHNNPQERPHAQHVRCLTRIGCEFISRVVFQKPLRKGDFCIRRSKEDYSREWFVSINLYRSRLFGRKGFPFAFVGGPAVA